MTETALFNNTYICLPDGLGKTYIATNVILNYYLWFDEGHIFFLAGNNKEVDAKVESIFTTPIIKTNHFADLRREDLSDTRVRESAYLKKRIFILTPQ